METTVLPGSEAVREFSGGCLCCLPPQTLSEKMEQTAVLPVASWTTHHTIAVHIKNIIWNDDGDGGDDNADDDLWSDETSNLFLHALRIYTGEREIQTWTPEATRNKRQI